MLSTHCILRTLHTSLPRFVRGPGRRANRGIGLQLSALQSENELEQDPESFGELESDFMNVHRTHRQHERDVENEREQIRQHMIRHKYFREQKLPNLLTYAEKEQLRLLHERDPEEWTFERLAESFPATPDIVQKVIQAKWRPRNEKRIRAHDEAVMRNWEQLRDDNSQLPTELQKHLHRFATRKQTDLSHTTQTSMELRKTLTELPKPKKQEFLSIITSCKNYAHKSKEIVTTATKQGNDRIMQSKDAPYAEPDAETYLLDKVKDRRKMRLQDLKQKKLGSMIKADGELQSATIAKLEAPERAVAFRNPSGTGIITDETKYVQKFQSNEIVISAEDRKRYEMTSVKERIHIPRKVWQKGATYRVEDNYYDDDGEYLYSVPGIYIPAAQKKILN